MPLARPPALRRWLAAALLGPLLWAASTARADLPPEVAAALARAKLPADALGVLVADADGKSPPRLLHRASVPMNPASVMKLVTTYVALDQLGPAFTWPTSVYLDGPVRDGVLQGNLVIKGQGDPKLVVERAVAAAAPGAGPGHPPGGGRHRARPQRV